MRNTISVSRLAAFILVGFLIGFSACKKDKFNANDAGNAALSGDLLGLEVIDTTITIYSYPVLSDSVKTDEVSTAMFVGSYVDPVFGKSTAGIYSQFSYGSSNSLVQSGDLSNVVFDSIVLSMPLVDLYGEADPQTFEVYQMTENIFIDSAYYSNNNKATTGINLVKSNKKTITPNSTGTGNINIHLDASIGDDVFAQSSLSSEAFAEWFKGLYITVNNGSQSSGEGAMLNVLIGEPGSCNLTFYYRNINPPNSSSKQYSFELIQEGAYFNNFSHDYTGTSVESALNNKTNGNSEFYIQSMSGVNAEIDFPHLSNLAEIEGFVVRKAELVFPYESSSINEYSQIDNLIALGYNSSGENIFLTDQFVGNIGGTNSSADNNYTFIITNFVNQLIQGDLEDNRLLIAPIGASINADRTIFNGQKALTSNKLKLKISYSIY